MNADHRASTGAASTFTPQGAPQATPQANGGAAPQRSSLRPMTGEVPTVAPRTFSAPSYSPAPQAPSASAPVSSQQPVSTSQPVSNQFRPAGQAPTASPFAPVTPQPVSNPQPVGGAQPVSGAYPTTGEQATQGEQHSFLSDAATGVGATVGAGFDKIKGFALKAKDDLTAGDDIAAASQRGGSRKARVLVSRVDPWSALKMGFLLSVALGIMLVVAVYVIWQTLNGMEVFALVQKWVDDLFTGGTRVDIMPFFALNKWMSAATLVAVINVLLLSALAALGALLYNTVSKVVGGVYVTLTDD
ncbi:DUF3566 domain-containing protein [Demequina sp.]|uniref:DUF3566 domain-containing protein n=1 Tax=Demequina sp. TaxID=2050685 RepID=UPI003A8C1E1D